MKYLVRLIILIQVISYVYCGNNKPCKCCAFCANCNGNKNVNKETLNGNQEDKSKGTIIKNQQNNLPDDKCISKLGSILGNLKKNDINLCKSEKQGIENGYEKNDEIKTPYKKKCDENSVISTSSKTGCNTDNKINNNIFSNIGLSNICGLETENKDNCLENENKVSIRNEDLYSSLHKSKQGEIDNEEINEEENKFREEKEKEEKCDVDNSKLDDIKMKIIKFNEKVEEEKINDEYKEEESKEEESKDEEINEEYKEEEGKEEEINEEYKEEKEKEEEGKEERSKTIIKNLSKDLLRVVGSEELSEGNSGSKESNSFKSEINSSIDKDNILLEHNLSVESMVNNDNLIDNGINKKVINNNFNNDKKYFTESIFNESEFNNDGEKVVKFADRSLSIDEFSDTDIINNIGESVNKNKSFNYLESVTSNNKYSQLDINATNTILNTGYMHLMSNNVSTKKKNGLKHFSKPNIIKKKSILNKGSNNIIAINKRKNSFDGCSIRVKGIDSNIYDFSSSNKNCFNKVMNYDDKFFQKIEKEKITKNKKVQNEIKLKDVNNKIDLDIRNEISEEDKNNVKEHISQCNVIKNTIKYPVSKKYKRTNIGNKEKNNKKDIKPINIIGVRKYGNVLNEKDKRKLVANVSKYLISKKYKRNNICIENKEENNKKDVKPINIIGVRKYNNVLNEKGKIKEISKYLISKKYKRTNIGNKEKNNKKDIKLINIRERKYNNNVNNRSEMLNEAIIINNNSNRSKRKNFDQNKKLSSINKYQKKFKNTNYKNCSFASYGRNNFITLINGGECVNNIHKNTNTTQID